MIECSKRRLKSLRQGFEPRNSWFTVQRHTAYPHTKTIIPKLYIKKRGIKNHRIAKLILTRPVDVTAGQS